MTDIEEYELSLYKSISVLKRDEFKTIEVVENTQIGNRFIKKTYHEDKREVFKILENINSKHVPQIIKVFFSSDTIVIEEYVEGILLSDLLKEQRKINVKTIIQDILNGVSELHLNNIIHRDIKPENIIIKSTGCAVIIDFDVSRIFDMSKSTDTSYFGTVGYAAPEQYGFCQSDYRTDIYAVGKTISEISKYITVPITIKYIGKKCESFDPDKRYQSINEIKRVLRHQNVNRIILICIALLSSLAIMLYICLGRGFAEIFSHNNANPIETTMSEKISIENVAQNTDVESGRMRQSLIVDASNETDILCFQVDSMEPCKFEIDVHGRMSKVSGIVINDNLKITVNGTDEFEFKYIPQSEPYDYEDTYLLYEIIMYDFNSDGVKEIIPVICDGRYVETEDYVLRNCSQAWCIFFNNDSSPIQADGMMISRLDPFRIFDSSPATIWGDFPLYYILVGAEIQQME